jgi:intracellular septation protein
MWLRVAVDYGALIAFAVAFLIAKLHHDPEALITATPTLMIGSVVAVAVGWLLERRLAPMPAIYGAFAIVFGGLTLIFHDKTFLKMKPTFAYAAFAIGLTSTLFFKNSPFKGVFGASIVMPEAAWRVLTIRYIAFFVASAAINEAVWRTQSDGVWVTYKLVYFVVVLAFSLAQTPFLMKHMQNPGETPPTAEPPDAGF